MKTTSAVTCHQVPRPDCPYSRPWDAWWLFQPLHLDFSYHSKIQAELFLATLAGVQAMMTRSSDSAVRANEVNIVSVIQEQLAHLSRSASWDTLPRGASLPTSHLIQKRLSVPLSFRHSVYVLKYGCSNLVTLIQATRSVQRCWRIYLSGRKCAGNWMFRGVICDKIKAVFLTSYLVSHEPYINVT